MTPFNKLSGLLYKSFIKVLIKNILVLDLSLQYTELLYAGGYN